jgi:hypothetical protein
MHQQGDRLPTYDSKYGFIMEKLVSDKWQRGLTVSVKEGVCQTPHNKLRRYLKY